MTLPAWLTEHILSTCPHCGTEIVNNALLTDRYCPNPACPEHMAHKVDVLAKRFGIKNVGVAAAREAVKAHRMKYHTQIIPLWFSEKPSLYLHEVGEIALIKGHQKKWRGYCEGKQNMMQVLQSPTLPADVKAQAPLLLVTESFCNVKPQMLGQTLNVMMSGSFDGYRSRSDFIADMNARFGHTVQLVDVGKRKTNVAFLIKEPYATDHEKSAIASAAGIPIVSPKELCLKLTAYCTYISRKEDNEC